MKITKRQLRRIIREEKDHLHEVGMEAPVPQSRLVAKAIIKAEDSLDQLVTALSQLKDLDPQEAAVMADYVAEQIHGWR